MRLIDADDIPYTMLYKENWMKGSGEEAQGAWKRDIDKMPTIDSVPVVRCGNCAKRGKSIPDGCPFGMTDDTCDPNAYCSYGVLSMKTGERKNDE